MCSYKLNQGEVMAMQQGSNKSSINNNNNSKQNQKNVGNDASNQETVKPTVNNPGKKQDLNVDRSGSQSTKR